MSLSHSWKVPTWISPLHSLPISVSHIYAICLGTSERNLCDLCGRKVRKSTFSFAFLHSFLLPPLDACFKEMCACQAELSPGRERVEVALICKICSVFILGMVVMGWGRGRGYGMSLHFITAWALALSFGTCHESKESLALITSHKYCTASDFRDGWQQARNYNELLQVPSSHKLQLFSSEPANLPTSGFWFGR